MNAVILGYGVVGKGIEILAKTLDDINIKYVYVRKEKENLPYFSNNEDMVVQDDIDIVFECSRWKTVKYQNRKRGSPRYERMGPRTRCNTLHTLVPANDRSYC